MLRFASITWIFLVVAWGPVENANAERWEIDRHPDHTEVRFISRATMESFEGKTREVVGWVALGPADSISWRISVDLASLDTGIGLRNRHMRENHLHTDEHPYAVFSGSVPWPDGDPGLVEGGVVDVELTGQFELHGVARERVILASLSLDPEGALQADARFEVSLAEHDIPLPKFLMLKLADVQEVQVRFLAMPHGGDQ